MADVAADVDGKVTSDGAWGRGQGVGGSEESSALLDDVLALPDHSGDWARAHVPGSRSAKEKSDMLVSDLLLLGGHDHRDHASVLTQ